jgi:hypothetical protein
LVLVVNNFNSNFYITSQPRWPCSSGFGPSCNGRLLGRQIPTILRRHIPRRRLSHFWTAVILERLYPSHPQHFCYLLASYLCYTDGVPSIRLQGFTVLICYTEHGPPQLLTLGPVLRRRFGTPRSLLVDEVYPSGPKRKHFRGPRRIQCRRECDHKFHHVSATPNRKRRSIILKICMVQNCYSIRGSKLALYGLVLGISVH